MGADEFLNAVHDKFRSINKGGLHFRLMDTASIIEQVSIDFIQGNKKDTANQLLWRKNEGFVDRIYVSDYSTMCTIEEVKDTLAALDRLSFKLTNVVVQYKME